MKKKKLMQAIKAVTDCLQELFCVTDKELVSKTLDPRWVTPSDVRVAVQELYGVFIPEQDYPNWKEFIRVTACAVVRVH